MGSPRKRRQNRKRRPHRNRNRQLPATQPVGAGRPSNLRCWSVFARGAIRRRLPDKQHPTGPQGKDSTARRCLICSSQMGDHEAQDTSLIAAPITSIQPGGGTCMYLELLWGRCRRAWLRLCFPKYVKRMAALRQGACTGPHDIIDPRDLKYYRNVCGYQFRAEDDRYAWRGRLGLARPGLAEVVVFSCVLAMAAAGLGVLGLLGHPLWYLGLVVIGVLWIFVVAFFRDPERVISVDPTVLVSPADGRVTHVEEVTQADFPGGRALRISIFLSIFNVHVNRLPRSGRVERLQYFPGAFLDARAGECPVRNEQLWIDLLDGVTGAPIRVKQIAGAIARRIVCWLRPGEEVKAGERLGMIKFGSRTDVLVPVERVDEVLIKAGDGVRGGSSLLLRLK